LLKKTYPAIKRARQDAIVLVGGLGGVRDNLNKMAADTFLVALYANGARGSFDGVSYHPYTNPNLPCSSGDALCTFSSDTSRKDPYGSKNGWNRMLHARSIMVANGDGAKKIWMTEYGGATNGPTDGYRVLSEDEQATLLIAGYARNSQYSWAGPLCWFTYQDEGVNPDTDPGGDWMGLVREDYSHKPAFTAYERLTRMAT
jgi:polysaccharide biosynthesis protein PslG